MDSLIEALLNAGAAGLIVIVVVLFLRHSRADSKDWRSEMAAQRQHDAEQVDVVTDRLAVLAKQTHAGVKSLVHKQELAALVAAVAETEEPPK